MFKIKDYRQFLTKNERNKVFLRKNSSEGRAIADSKYRTKKILESAGIGVPKLLARFRNNDQLERFEWEKLDGNFVIKPVGGYGGEGILIIRKRISKSFQLMDGKMISVEDLKGHCRDILVGKYSLHGLKDAVIIEERIKIHPMFLGLTKSGTPDVGVVVYNQVPVMAFLRVPTAKSGGKANLQLGALGLGVDMATGITTFGVRGKEESITKIVDLGSKKLRKVNGIKIPRWQEILETAIKTQRAVRGLGFMRVDVVLDKDEGPKVLEVNARPGLSIQICNKAGLKARMNRVEGVEIRSVAHGISLAKYLFGERFAEKLEQKERMASVSPIEVIKVKIPKGFQPDLQKSQTIKQGKHRVVEVRAKVDTGAFRSSIDRTLAEKLGLLVAERVLYYRHYRSALGNNKDRPVVGVVFWLRGKRVVTAVNVADRSKLRTKFLIGRKDLEGFVVSTKKNDK